MGVGAAPVFSGAEETETEGAGVMIGEGGVGVMVGEGGVAGGREERTGD